VLHWEKDIEKSIKMTESTNISIGVSNTPKYDITWTENGDVIYRFIPEILSFKKLGK